MPAFVAPPLVSVVLPAYNAAAHIVDTLRTAQRQSYQPIEIVVVDDGSTDETAALVEAVARSDARVRLLRQHNAGVAAARNAAIAASSGALIAPLDADDAWHPEKLRLQVERMLGAGPDVGVVYTDFEETDAATGRRLHVGPHDLPEGDLRDVFVYRNPIPCASTPLFRREALDRAGLYATTMRARDAQGCEDWDLYLRLAEHTRFAVVQAPVVTYRRVAGSMSTDPVRMERSYEMLMQRLHVRRPDVDPALLRRSRRRVLLYLAGIHRRRGDVPAALRYLARAAWADARSLLRKPPSVHDLREMWRSIGR